MFQSVLPVSNFGIRSLEFVSDFEIRISDSASIPQQTVHIRAVHGGMASGGPTSPEPDQTRMVGFADIELAGLDGYALDLGVASEAKIRIALVEQLRIDGPMRCMAHGAAFTQCRVLEDCRPRLLPMAGGAGLVGAGHRESSGGFENIRAVRVVALRTAHVVLKEGMVLRQMKLRFDGAMAFKTGGRILARVDNKFTASAATADVQASGPVAGFTARLSRGAGVFQTDARVRAGREVAANIGMAFGAGLIADKSCAWDLWRRDQSYGSGRTGVDQQPNPGRKAQRQRGKDDPAGSHEGRFVTAPALSISATISSERFPLVGKTICR